MNTNKKKDNNNMNLENGDDSDEQFHDDLSDSDNNNNNGILSSDDDSDSDSDSDSDVSHDNQHSSAAYEVDHLEIKVRENPYSYDANTDFITALRKLVKSSSGSNKADSIKRLREAREKFQSIFPLPENIWLEWLVDEQSYAMSNENHQDYIFNLYEKAVNDFISTNIWISYCKYLQNTLLSSSSSIVSENPNLERVRNLYERATQSVCNHILESPSIWSEYRNFEEMLFITFQKQQNQQELEKQVQRIRKLYHRQLSNPQIKLDTLYQEYNQWESSLPQQLQLSSKDTLQLVESKLKESIKLYEERKPFEDSLQQLTGSGTIDKKKKIEIFNRWKEYITFEQKSKKPSRVASIFERALRTYYSFVELWTLYLNFIEKDLKSMDLYFQVFSRAIRNIYWSGDLWSHYLRSLEKYNKTSEINESFERAILSGLQSAQDTELVFNTFFDFQWRLIKSKEQKPYSEESKTILRTLFQRMSTYFTQYAVDSYVLTEVQMNSARFELEEFDSGIEEYRKIVDYILTYNFYQYYVWSDYINVERSLKNYDKCRELFKVAVKSIQETSRIWQDWLSFERQFGTLQQYEYALNTNNQQTMKWMHHQEKQLEKEKEREEKREKEKELKRKKREEKSVDKKAKKKKTNGKQSTVVFVSNLSFETKEDEIKNKFSECGEIASLRLVRDRRGKSKGICFIEYKDLESSEKAIDMNGIKLDDFSLKIEYSKKPIKEVAAGGGNDGDSMSIDTVSSSMTTATTTPSNPPSTTTTTTTTSTAATPHPTTTTATQTPLDYYNSEGITVFINNLSRTVTKEKLEDYFTKHNVKYSSVRLIIKPGGAKPFAYVDLIDQDNVSKALALNQKYFMGKILNIARSKPPGQPKQHQAPTPMATDSKPTFDTSVQPRRQTLMIPRGIKKSASTPTTTTTTAPTTNGSNPSDSN
eukprot:gene4110-5142_t